MQLALQKRCSQWRCLSHKRCNRSRPENHQRSIFVVNESNLGKGSYELSLSHRIRKVPSHRPGYCIDVACCQVSVSLEDAWLPHCQRGGGQVAKRTQVQVARVTRTVKMSSFSKPLIEMENHLNSAEVTVDE